MSGNRGGRLPDKNYIMGYSEAFVGLLRRRSADINAAYLLPYLKPGHRVLDFGCGPGTISVGLAKAVEPGDLHGIDMEASQIEIARAAAAAGGARQRRLSHRTGHRSALCRRYVRRRPLPRRAAARARYSGYVGRGEAGIEAGRRHRGAARGSSARLFSSPKPRVVGAGFESHQGPWRASRHRQGTEARVSRSRVRQRYGQRDV